MKILICSTCYDLEFLRDTIRNQLTSLGYDPILSERYDILYDPLIHTHQSCIDSVVNSDIVLLIIGNRYGGEVMPEFANLIEIMDDSKNKEFSKIVKEKHLSVTQAEVLTAFHNNIPVFTFIESSLLAYHKIYEDNKTKATFEAITFPNFKPGTVKYIFEFFNYIRLKKTGNAYFEFHNPTEIVDTLKKQLILKFQDLLLKEKKNNHNNKNYVYSKIVKHISKEREESFNELFSEINENDEIRILGTGVTKFLSKIEEVEWYLERGNKIKLLLINDQIIKMNWACSSEEFIERFNNLNTDQKNLLNELTAKTLCPLASLNVLIDKNHFVNYYSRKDYIAEMAKAYELIGGYKEKVKANKWNGDLEVKHFFSFVPMSITAVFPDQSNNKKLLVEFIIPFTKNRIILKSSLTENHEIYNLFIDFFDQTWDKSQLYQI